MAEVSGVLNNKTNSFVSVGRYNKCLEAHMTSLKHKKQI